MISYKFFYYKKQQVYQSILNKNILLSPYLPEQISLAVGQLADGATVQATSAEEANAQLSEILDGLNMINNDMENSNSLTEKAMTTVRQGEKIVQIHEEKTKITKDISDNVRQAMFALSQKPSAEEQTSLTQNIAEAAKELAELANKLQSDISQFIVEIN